MNGRRSPSAPDGRNPERNYAYLHPVLWPSTKKRVWSKEHILEVLFKFLFSIDLKHERIQNLIIFAHNHKLKLTWTA